MDCVVRLQKPEHTLIGFGFGISNVNEANNWANHDPESFMMISFGL